MVGSLELDITKALTVCKEDKTCCVLKERKVEKKNKTIVSCIYHESSWGYGFNWTRAVNMNLLGNVCQ